MWATIACQWKRRLVCWAWCAGCQLLLLCCCCCCCCLKAGFTSSLLNEIPTTSLPPRMAEDIVSASKGLSIAINLDKKLTSSAECSACRAPSISATTSVNVAMQQTRLSPSLHGRPSDAKARLRYPVFPTVVYMLSHNWGIRNDSMLNH